MTPNAPRRPPAAVVLAAVTLVVSLVALIASPVGADEPFGRDPRLAYRGTNILQRWAAGHMIDYAQPITEAEAVAVAEAHDFVIAIRNDFTEHVPAMKAANPDLRIYLTLNAMYQQSWKGPDSDQALPDHWYARDADGNYVRATATGNWMMDPSNPEWAAYVRDTCVAVRTSSNYDQCYLDLLGPAPLVGTYNTGLAIDPRTGEVWTYDDLYLAGLTIADAVRSVNSDGILISNSLANGNRYFGEGDFSTRRLLAGIDDMPGIDVGQFETFLRDAGTPVDGWPDLDRWLRDVDALQDVADSGFVAITNTKTWYADATPEQRDQWHAFALATFLLATDGRQFFNFSAEKTLAASTADHPWDRIDPGVPLEPYTWRDGVYQRRFTDAVVMVNPTDTAATVVLPGPHRTLRGDLVTTIEMSAHTGEVLLVEPVPPTTTVAPTTTTELVALKQVTSTDPSRPSFVVSSFANRLEIQADALGGASLYQLKYRPIGGPAVWFGPSSGRSWTLDGLEVGVGYEISVRALTGQTWGGWTVTTASLLPAVVGGGETTTTSTPATTSMPTTTTSTTVPDGSVVYRVGSADPLRPGLTATRRPEVIDVVADPVASAVAYQLKYQDLSTGRTTWFPAGSSPQWTIDGLDASATYRLSARALVGSVWQGWTVLTAPPVPPASTTTTVPPTTTTVPASTTTTTLPASTTTVPPTTTTVPASTTTVPSTTTTVPASTTTVPSTTTTSEVEGIETRLESNDPTRPTLVVTRYPDRLEIIAEPVSGATSYQLKWRGTGSTRWFAASATPAWVIDDIDPTVDYVISGRVLIGPSWRGWTSGTVRAQ